MHCAKANTCLFGAAENEHRVALVQGLLSQDGTGLGVLSTPVGAAVNGVHYLCIAVYYFVANQQPLVQCDWPVGAKNPRSLLLKAAVQTTVFYKASDQRQCGMQVLLIIPCGLAKQWRQAWRIFVPEVSLKQLRTQPLGHS